jgi:hypothetical protein
VVVHSGLHQVVHLVEGRRLVQARAELSGLQLQVQAGPSVEAVGRLDSRPRLLQLLVVPPPLMPSAGGHSDNRRLPRPSGQREEVLERQRSVLIPVGHLGVEVGSERLQSQPSGPASQPLGRSQQLVALGRLRRLVLERQVLLEHRQLVALVLHKHQLLACLVQRSSRLLPRYSKPSHNFSRRQQALRGWRMCRATHTATSRSSNLRMHLHYFQQTPTCRRQILVHGMRIRRFDPFSNPLHRTWAVEAHSELERLQRGACLRPERDRRCGTGEPMGPCP